MAAKTLTRKDAPAPSGILPSKGTHVVAVLVDEKFETEVETQLRGFLRNLGDTRTGWCEQTDARRFSPEAAEKVAAFHNQSASLAKRKERFEAREFEDLFGE